MSQDNSTKPLISERFDGFGVSIFSQMTGLAQTVNAVNLGQGAPDDQPDSFVKESASQAALGNVHQYSRSQGHPQLVSSLARLYSKPLQREINPLTEIQIGVGATEIGFSATSGLLNPGDEVVLFEPFFDCYNAWSRIAQAKQIFVPLKHFTELTNPCITNPNFTTHGFLRADDYTFDIDVLKQSITDKTRLLFLNTPHNPLGKVFTLRELETIAEIVRQYPKLIVFSDEVYDFLLHTDTGVEYTARGLPLPEQYANITSQTPPPTLLRFATLPGMWNQTLTIGSAGKMFSITGWKVGWAIGPAHLVQAIATVHQWVSFCVATPLQIAVANAIDQAQENGYYTQLQQRYTEKRDLLYTGLLKAGLSPIFPSAGYFVVADANQWAEPLGLTTTIAEQSNERYGTQLAKLLCQQVKVSSIPVAEFYHQPGQNSLLRFAYCKDIAAIKQGCLNLQTSDILQKKE